MRNDAIERSVNDALLTIADYILQMIEQARKQRDLDMKRLMDQESRNLQRDFPSLTKEARAEAEYEVYYALIKDRQPDLFEVNGNPVETFPVDNQSVFQIFQDKDKFYGVYMQNFKEPHRITESFRSKEELFQNTFGTSEFEKFRSRSFFLSEGGKTFSLHDNKQLRLNLVKPFKSTSTFENIEQARLSVVKEELKNDLKLRRQALRRTLEENHIPSDLMGKTVTLNSISKEDKGIRISLEENEKERQIWLPDLAEKWLDRVRDHSRLKAPFDEMIMDSRSIGEGFLAFYGIEINKVLQTKQHNFEVISNKEGSYIGKLNGVGKVKQLSPYFSEKEAEKQLGNLNNHIQVEIQKNRHEDKEVEPSLEFVDIIEKN